VGIAGHGGEEGGGVWGEGGAVGAGVGGEGEERGAAVGVPLCHTESVDAFGRAGSCRRGCRRDCRRATYDFYSPVPGARAECVFGY